MVDASGMPNANVYASEAYFNQLLAKAVAAKASDIHLKVGIPPAARVRGELVFFRTEPLRKEDTDNIARLVIADTHKRNEIPTLREYDCAYAAAGVGRFRVNVYRQRGTLGIVMRSIPTKIPNFEDLGLPTPCQYLAERERGLVLVVGAAGNGKSSTLAAMIGHLNKTQPLHIVTIEDPIEFLHTDDKSSISQREVGIDTGTFADALRAALRQDPDVILVGEMRDLETISTALTAAETGHLVFATLHTQDAPQSVDRVIDVFPAHQQQQVRVQLAAALQGICTQQLVPTIDGAGRAVCCEVMVATPAIRNLIREGKVHQIYSMLQAGGKYGMVTMDMSLAQLVRSHRISLDAALERCANEDDLRRLLNGGG